MRIRPMLPTDAEDVAGLAAQLGYWVTAEKVRTRLSQIELRPGNAFFLAESDQALAVGWVHVYAVHLLETRPYGEIGGLVVGQEQRRQGIGRALIHAALDWAQSARLRELRLEAGTHRSEAHAFYDAVGFERGNVGAKFRWPLTNLEPT